MKLPTIVVITFNRINSLKKLIWSLQNADYKNYNQVDLFISIDGNAPKELI